jgi:hypothetical protein
MNYFTKENYQGGNIALLEQLNITEPVATFLQWKNGGFKVKKGAKGIPMRTFVGATKTVKRANGKEEAINGSVPRAFYVFKLSDVEEVK